MVWRSIYRVIGTSQVVLVVRNPSASAGELSDMGLIPGSGRSSRGHSNPLQYSCLENLVDRGAWWAAVPGIAKSQAQLKRLHSATPGLLSLEPEGMGARIGLSLLSGIPNISTVLQAF